MNGKFDPRVVVVTGASAGVGRATAIAFAKAGLSVALVSRNASRLQAARAEIDAIGGKSLCLCVDVADPAAVEAAAERIERELGPIDVWVNNAMATIFAAVDDITPEEFARVTAVTYLGTVHGTMTALRRMRGRDRGCIVQVGSALAYRSIPLQSAYCGAKAAIRGFTDSLRCELIHDRSNVRLSMVQLSAFNTPQFDWARNRLGKRLQPVPPIFQPELAARAIVRAARERPREIWVGWPAVKAIAFNRLSPALGDRYAASHAYDAQHGQQPDPPGRLDNLFDSVDGPQAAHGRFDACALDGSREVWLRRHIGWIGAAVALVVAGLWLACAA